MMHFNSSLSMTTARQETIRGTLRTLVDAIEADVDGDGHCVHGDDRDGVKDKGQEDEQVAS